MPRWCDRGTEPELPLKCVRIVASEQDEGQAGRELGLDHAPAADKVAGRARSGLAEWHWGTYVAFTGGA